MNPPRIESCTVSAGCRGIEADPSSPASPAPSPAPPPPPRQGRLVWWWAGATGGACPFTRCRMMFPVLAEAIVDIEPACGYIPVRREATDDSCWSSSRRGKRSVLDSWVDPNSMECMVVTDGSTCSIL